MSGYRGDGYGQYGNVGDDDFRWGDDEPRPPAAQGSQRGLADDPRAVRAADEWREQFGREGYQGSYAQHDETYLSYRERHLAELDNDYQEYCRENGKEFSGAFESWRASRRGGMAVPAISAAGGAPEGGLTDGPTAALGGEAMANSPAETSGKRGARTRR